MKHSEILEALLAVVVVAATAAITTLPIYVSVCLVPLLSYMASRASSTEYIIVDAGGQEEAPAYTGLTLGDKTNNEIGFVR